MKNFLKYYYDIDANDIHHSGKKYYFNLNSYLYTLLPYYGSQEYLDNLYSFCSQLSQQGIYFNLILKNKFQKILTPIENVNYILICSLDNLDKNIEYKDILNFTNYYLSNGKLDSSNWKELWKNKIDYFEYQLNQLGYKYPLLRESFGYFAGYVENAIMLLNFINVDKNNLVLSHKRINKNYKLYDLYDPFNMILDYRVRDMAEYLKSDILNSNLFEKTIEHLKLMKLKNYEYSLFFIRLLYPSFYFDVFEEIIDNELDEKDIIPIIEKTIAYENLIKKIYKVILPLSNLPNIEWLSY